MTTTTAFCSDEQIDTDHVVDIDGNGEILLTCNSNVGTEDEPKVCGRFLKFPRGTDAPALTTMLEKHKEENEGQITVASMEEEKTVLLEGLNQEDQKDNE